MWKLRKGALCALCGTTRAEKTSFPKEAQWRNQQGDDFKVWHPPKVLRKLRAFATRSYV